MKAGSFSQPPLSVQPATDDARWRLTLVLIFGILLLRIVYQRWLSPWELVGDEAYYWVQSQHLDWCYNEKGALFPWLIRLSCWVFGDTQFAVRMPVLLGSTAAAWMLGRLTLSLSFASYCSAARGASAALIAVGLFFLVPAMQANAQVSTQDGLLIPWTLAMAAIGLRLTRRWSRHQNTWAEWLLWWAALGIGMHLRFSAPLILTAPITFAVIRRRNLRFNRVLVYQQIAGAGIFLLLLAPIIFWNAAHGWPTFEHTAGHLGLGGDQAGHRSKGNPPLWIGETLGGLIGAYGPVLVLLVWASVSIVRTRRDVAHRQWCDRLWILCATWPSVAFFVLLSFTKPVVASWPLPSLVPALALCGMWIDENALFSSLSRPWFRPLWTAALGYGIVGALVLMFPTWLTYLPVVGDRINAKVVSRIQGHAKEAAMVDAVRKTYPPGASPALLATYYDAASLLWFYLPDHPVVHVASHRPSTYDNWPDTRLDAASLDGQSMLLIGKSDTPWSSAVRFQSVTATPNESIYFGNSFQGRLAPRTAVAGASASRVRDK